MLAIPAAVLTGLAFAAPMTAFAVIAARPSRAFSAIFRFVITPLFLFSGTFFPVTQLPAVLRWIAYVTPLWHGVALCRALALAPSAAPAAIGHVAVLCAFAGVGPGAGVPLLPAEARRPDAARSGHLGLVPRVAPPVLFGGRRAARLVERNAMVYRRIWLILVSGFFEPLFYLLSIGVGIGKLVGDITLPDGRIIDYTAFVAPALLASSAMNGAVYDSTFNVFDKLKWTKDLRRRAGHADRRRRRGPRRDHLGPDPRR